MDFTCCCTWRGCKTSRRKSKKPPASTARTDANCLTYITLPLLGSTIRTTVYLSVVGSLQQFILVWIMTKGGPVNASEVMATYMYRFGFVRFWLGYGSAVAIVMFLICLTFSLIYQRMTRQPDYLGGM